MKSRLMIGGTHGNEVNKARHRIMGTQRNGDPRPKGETRLAERVGEIVHEAKLDSENTGPCKVLVKGGHWAVPPAQRPSNWKSLGVPE